MAARRASFSGFGGMGGAANGAALLDGVGMSRGEDSMSIAGFAGFGCIGAAVD